MPSTLLTTKAGTEKVTGFLRIYIHIQVEARLVPQVSTFTFRWKHAYSLVVRIRYYTKNKNFSGYEVLQGLILSIWRSSSGSVMSLNGSDPRDAYHPGDTGTVQNRTGRRLCRMLLPQRLQQHLPCGPHGPVLCLWHLCMPTPPEI